MTEPRLRVVVAGGLPLLYHCTSAALDSREDLCVVATVYDSSRVLPEVRRHSPDVAIVGVDVAGWDGLSVCADIKQLTQPVRVVAIGVGADHDMLLAAVGAGADGYVGSNEPLEGLVAALRAVHRSEAHIPPGMLGALLNGLIQARRQDDAAVRRFGSLSAREIQVLTLMMDGLDGRDIGERLFLSPHTARTHIQNIFSKLGVHSRLETVTFVLDHDLLERRNTTSRASLHDNRQGCDAVAEH